MIFVFIFLLKLLFGLFKLHLILQCEGFTENKMNKVHLNISTQIFSWAEYFTINLYNL